MLRTNGYAGQGGFPLLVENIWLPEDESEAIVNALLPRVKKSQTALQETLFEVIALEVALEEDVDAVLLATLMPKRWAEFIREGPKGDIDELGVVKLSKTSDN